MSSEMQFEMSQYGQYDPYALEMSQFGGPYGYTQGYDAPAVAMQSGFYPESSTAAFGQEERRGDYSIACVICTVLVVMLISGLSLYLVLASGDKDVTDEPDDIAVGGGGGGGESSSGDSGPNNEDDDTTLPGGFPGGPSLPGGFPGASTVPGGLPTVPGVITSASTVPGGATGRPTGPGGVTSARTVPGGVTTSIRPTTTTTIAPTAALVPRTVMCTTQSAGPGNDPPQHLCDIVLYDAGFEDLQVSRPAGAESFVDHCRKSRTVCGLNIERLYRVTSYLYKRDAETAMRNFYAAGIKNYGFLRTALTASSKPDDVRFAAELLAQLQKFLKVTGKDRDILFWGVSPILEGASSPPDAMMQVFLGVLKSVSVNMLVYQTTHAGSSLSSDPGCLSTGPAMWMSAPLSTQATFVDALNFWKVVRAQNLLPDVQEMFAITLCGFVTRYKSKVAKPMFGVKTDCDTARSGPVEDYVCTGGKNSTNFLPGTLLKDSQQYVTTTVDKDWAVGYDMNDTIIQKICMTSVNYDYDGGWVMHGLDCNFKEHCGGKDVGGFPRLRDMKKAMQMKFTKCDYTN